MNKIFIKSLSCCLLLTLAGGCSLIPTKEEEALRAEQQRREQRQQALARLAGFKGQCYEMGFVDDIGISNCQLDLSIAYDANQVLALRNQFQANRFLKVAGDFEKAMAGFRQLCSDLGFQPETRDYGNCVLKLQEANKSNIKVAVNQRNVGNAFYSNLWWSAFLAYAIVHND